MNTSIEAFERHPAIHWVAGRADDLLPGPTRLPFPPQLPSGLVEAGTIGTYVADHGYTPITCTGVTFRKSTVRALGGWVATPRAEDLAFMVAIAELTPGYLTPEVTWLYRRHAGQVTRQTAWTQLHAESMTLVRQRIDALRDVALRLG